MGYHNRNKDLCKEGNNGDKYRKSFEVNTVKCNALWQNMFKHSCHICHTLDCASEVVILLAK